MNVENIDIDALIGLTKQSVYNLRQTINDELDNNDAFRDDLKPAIKETLLNLTHNTICNQVEYILGIHYKKEFSDMRGELDDKVREFIDGEISLDDLIRFIQNLYIELLKMESEALDKRVNAVLERKTIMVGRQCIGH